MASEQNNDDMEAKLIDPTCEDDYDLEELPVHTERQSDDGDTVLEEKEARERLRRFALQTPASAATFYDPGVYGRKHEGCRIRIYDDPEQAQGVVFHNQHAGIAGVGALSTQARLQHAVRVMAHVIALEGAGEQKPIKIIITAKEPMASTLRSMGQMLGMQVESRNRGRGFWSGAYHAIASGAQAAARKLAGRRAGEEEIELDTFSRAPSKGRVAGYFNPFNTSRHYNDGAEEANMLQLVNALLSARADEVGTTKNITLRDMRESQHHYYGEARQVLQGLLVQQGGAAAEALRMRHETPAPDEEEGAIEFKDDEIASMRTHGDRLRAMQTRLQAMDKSGALEPVRYSGKFQHFRLGALQQSKNQQQNEPPSADPDRHLNHERPRNQTGVEF